MSLEPRDLLGLQQEMGTSFDDPMLLRRALTHASYVNENPTLASLDNERLEFLGDAVCGFLAAEHLHRRHPEWREGQLTALRAQLVCSETLARFAQEIDLGRHLLLGRGEELLDGRSRMTMLGDAFEALVGALYLDQGLQVTREFFLRLAATHLDGLSEDEIQRDAKTSFQEWAQARYRVTPRYVTVSEAGPDHAKEFAVEVLIQDKVCGHGVGRSKRTAEQSAARAAMEAISDQAVLPGHDDY